MEKPHLVFKTENYPLSIYWYGHVERELPAGFKLDVGPRVRVAKRDVVARFDDKDEALRLVQSICGTKGEFERRVLAARLAYQKTVAALIAKAE